MKFYDSFYPKSIFFRRITTKTHTIHRGYEICHTNFTSTEFYLKFSRGRTNNFFLCCMIASSELSRYSKLLCGGMQNFKYKFNINGTHFAVYCWQNTFSFLKCIPTLHFKKEKKYLLKLFTTVIFMAAFQILANHDLKSSIYLPT